MKRILVTGSNGQLGKCFQKAANNHPDFDFDFRNSRELDITKINNSKTIFAEGNFDYCINCAAYTDVEQAEKTPEIAFEVNANGVKNLAINCLEYDVILIHISTDYVFDGEKEEPYTVDDIPNPINEYGKSKLAGEKYIQEILKDYFIIRTSWLYSEFGKNFYTTILKKARNRENLEITADQIGCPTNANNLASYILNRIVDNNKNYGVHHFTDGDAMTWYDFAEKILIENKLLEKVQLDKAKNYRTFAIRPVYSILK